MSMRNVTGILVTKVPTGKEDQPSLPRQKEQVQVTEQARKEAESDHSKSTMIEVRQQVVSAGQAQSRPDMRPAPAQPPAKKAPIPVVAAPPPERRGLAIPASMIRLLKKNMRVGELRERAQKERIKAQAEVDLIRVKLTSAENRASGASDLLQQLESLPDDKEVY